MRQFHSERRSQCANSLTLIDSTEKIRRQFSKIFKTVSNDQELQTERVSIRRIRYIRRMTGFWIEISSKFMKSNSCLLSLDLGDPSDFGRPYRKKSAVDFSKIFETVSNAQELQTERLSIRRIRYIRPMIGF